MTKTKRIVCYAINGSGLGHLTRLTAIARWLRRYVALLDGRPPEVLFLTSSDASDSLSQAGFAAFKIPSKTIAKKAELNKLEYRRLAKHFVWNTLGVFAPDLFVVDTFPSGSFDELFQVLDGPFKKGFIYREVKPDYAARPTFRSAIGMYDVVVVPHQQEPKSGQSLNGNGRSNGQVSRLPTGKCCGEVIQFDREELLPVEQARQELGVASGDRLVYVSAGGGGDPSAEENLRSIVESLHDQPNVHLLVGAGPLYRGARMSAPRLTWFDSHKVWRYFAAVDAAVSAGGYNTFHELLFARVPTAFFAQDKIADDQARRVRAAEQLGACRRIADIANRDEVRREVRELLSDAVASKIRNACDQLLAENGARHCAIELLRPLYDERRLVWAAEILSPRVTHSLERVGSSSGVIAEWLTQLMPSGNFAPTSRHDLEAVLPRLSDEAAEELQAILSDDAQSADTSFEDTVVELLDSIEARAEIESEDNNAQLLADEVLKTIAAAMKKQPLESNSKNRTSWVCEIILGIQTLFQLQAPRVSTCDVLRLYRMFPKIAGVTPTESFQLFSEFLNHRLSMNEQTHEIIHQLQVLKITHSKFTRETLHATFDGAAK